MYKACVAVAKIDLGNDLSKYQSRFLALHNHRRDTEEILEVSNFYGSNDVCVKFFYDYVEDNSYFDKESKDFKEWFERCRTWSEQFGEVKEVTLYDGSDKDINYYVEDGLCGPGLFDYILED